MSAIAPVGTPSAGAAALAADPEIAIAALEQQMGDLQLTTAQSRAQQLSTNRQASLQKAKQALRDAQKKEDEGGFFSKLASKAKTVATVATIVAAAAACGTGVGAPAGLALVAVACSAGSFAMKETGADTKLGTLSVGDTKIDLNLSDCVAIAGAVCGGAGSASLASQSASQGTSTLNVACRVSQGVATATSAVATGAQAVFTLEAGDAQARAVELHADSRGHTNQADKAKSATEEQVDIMRNAMETRRKIVEAVSKLMEERHNAVIRLMEVRA